MGNKIDMLDNCVREYKNINIDELLVHEATAMAFYERNGMIEQKAELEKLIQIRKEIDRHFARKRGLKEKIICMFIGHSEKIKVDNIETCKRCGNVQFK